MVKLFDITDVIRSKNSGPFELTFDMIFKDVETYELVATKKCFNKEMFAKLYNISEDDILAIVNFEPAKAIKVTIKRPITSGNLGETDVYGAQQHAPLFSLELDI